MASGMVGVRRAARGPCRARQRPSTLSTPSALSCAIVQSNYANWILDWTAECLHPHSMQRSPSVASASRQLEAVLLGTLGVAAFSLTLPATKLALHGLAPIFVSLGRAPVSATLSSV